MFSLSSSTITSAISEASKETKILYCAMKILLDEPNIKLVNLVDALNSRDSRPVSNKELSYRGGEHYYCCAKMYLRLYSALNNKVEGYTYFNEKDYIQLLCSGIT